MKAFEFGRTFKKHNFARSLKNDFKMDFNTKKKYINLMRREILLLFILSFSFVATTFAQECQDENSRHPITGEFCLRSISTAVPFLRIVPSSRGAAMGDVGIALSPDANSIHFNASSLAFAEEDMSLAVTFTPWLRALGLNDVYLAYLSGFKRLNDLQTVGFSLRYFSLGSIQFTDNDGNLLSQGKPYEFDSDLASGQQVPGQGETIEAGVAGAADVGITYQSPVSFNDIDSDLRIGLAVTNIGSKITYTNSINRDFLPANFGLGAAWKFNLDNYNTFTVATDFNKLLVPSPVDDGSHLDQSVISGVLGSFSDAPAGAGEELREVMLSVGLEYWYDKQFAVRAGYFNEHASKGNRKYLTVGLGLKYNVFGLDLSYLVPTTSQQNPLDNTLRFTLLFDFGADPIVSDN